MIGIVHSAKVTFWLFREPPASEPGAVAVALQKGDAKLPATVLRGGEPAGPLLTLSEKAALLTKLAVEGRTARGVRLLETYEKFALGSMERACLAIRMSSSGSEEEGVDALGAVAVPSSSEAVRELTS